MILIHIGVQVGEVGLDAFGIADVVDADEEDAALGVEEAADGHEDAFHLAVYVGDAVVVRGEDDGGLKLAGVRLTSEVDLLRLAVRIFFHLDGQQRAHLGVDEGGDVRVGLVGQPGDEQ